MVHFTALMAATMLALCLTALASPVTYVSRPSPPKLSVDRSFQGYNEKSQVASISIAADDDKVIPEIRLLDEDQFSNDTTAIAEPFTPADALLTRLARRFVLGQDSRKLFNYGAFPFHSAGKLQWDNGVFCSGALVGPRHVLTARHCLPDDGVSGTFAPGFDEDARFGEANVVTALASTGQEEGSPCETKADWAVLVLDQKLGDKLGYFGVKNPDSSMFDQPRFYHMGYPGDKDSGSRPYRISDVTVYSERTFDCDPTGPFYTDADTAGGQSGGPHWELDWDGNRWIWGALSIGVSWGDNQGYSGFASGAQMIDAINQLRDEFP